MQGLLAESELLAALFEMLEVRDALVSSFSCVFVLHSPHLKDFHAMEPLLLKRTLYLSLTFFVLESLQDNSHNRAVAKDQV